MLRTRFATPLWSHGNLSIDSTCRWHHEVTWWTAGTDRDYQSGLSNPAGPTGPTSIIMAVQSVHIDGDKWQEAMGIRRKGFLRLSSLVFSSSSVKLSTRLEYTFQHVHNTLRLEYSHNAPNGTSGRNPLRVFLLLTLGRSRTLQR
jgi:hypothetical protein